MGDSVERKILKVWYDPEGDYLEVIFDQKEGYFRETENDQVMEKVDPQGNVWVTFTGQMDHIVTKFTRSGKFLLDIGRRGQTRGINDTATLGSPTQATVDGTANEVYVADGYGNRRVHCFTPDGERGGHGPLACARIGADGVYVLTTGADKGAVPGCQRNPTRRFPLGLWPGWLLSRPGRYAKR